MSARKFAPATRVRFVEDTPAASPRTGDEVIIWLGFVGVVVHHINADYVLLKVQGRQVIVAMEDMDRVVPA